MIDEWLRAVVSTPGLTAIRDVVEARRVLVEDSLRGRDVVAAYGGPVVDVGSGGGAPGIPLAAALPDVEVTLLEAERRKADFLEGWGKRLPNLRVVWGRAEEQPVERFRIAVAKALAAPPVAAEWCLPLVATGGAAVLWVGPSADRERVARVAAEVGGRLVESPPGLLVLEKIAPTPARFPRRTGVARRRPLA